MKAYWEKLAVRIDALTMRERLAIFAGVAAIMLLVVQSMLLAPQSERQKRILQQLNDDKAELAQIRQQLMSPAADPDAANRQRLKGLNEQIATMQASIEQVQNTLVAPDKMAELLKSILQKNGRLQLLALKTLPTTGMQEIASGTQAKVDGASDKKQAPTDKDVVYRHGVQITVQGNYFDMVGYMQELEGMPWRLYWGKAELDASAYPKDVLTLTLYTLSLDRTWLNI